MPRVRGQESNTKRDKERERIIRKEKINVCRL